MAKRRTARADRRAQRNLQKQAGMKRPGGASKYAKKAVWLNTHGVFGFEVASPKPWRS